jgi:hypothetical protein
MTASFDQTPSETSQPVERVSNFVRATGRARKAGYWVCSAGIAVALSAFLPWVSVDGLYSTHPSGGGVLLLLVIGGLLAFFGSRVLRGRLSRAITVALWAISAIDVVLSLALFGNLSQLNNESAGLASIQPSTGFYVALGGLVASVVGTVLAQTVRRAKVSVGEPVSHDH